MHTKILEQEFSNLRVEEFSEPIPPPLHSREWLANTCRPRAAEADTGGNRQTDTADCTHTHHKTAGSARRSEQVHRVWRANWNATRQNARCIRVCVCVWTALVKYSCK